MQKNYMLLLPLFFLMLVPLISGFSVKPAQGSSNKALTDSTPTTVGIPAAGLPSPTTGAPQMVLIYRAPGPVGCAGCSEAVATMLQNIQQQYSYPPVPFDVQYVGPNESLSVSAGLASSYITQHNVVLYVQPGGDGQVEQADPILEKDGSASAIKNFVQNGGHYLGLCMGGYLAGQNPGFNLLPGDSGEYTTEQGATIQNTNDAIVQVNWGGQARSMYFQDGPDFTLNQGATGATILATYTTGQIAAMVTPYGNGKVGVSGPHPEATTSWYSSAGLTDPGATTDLGADLIETLLHV